jgi:squalene synthase HpnC
MLAPKHFIRDKAAMDKVWSQQEASAYTKWLATSHYENFHIVSFLLPKRLHQDFYNVYAYCRWADDLGDELDNRPESLRMLSWWRDELQGMLAGHARHPVFVALAPTVERYGLPEEELEKLIQAFEQDQTKTRYQHWGEVMDYCTRSANPVGRLVLGLCGYQDAARFALSDATCTALQLANFWQDVSVDLEKDRIYLPRELMEKYGVEEEQLFARRHSAAFAAVMREACGVARELFEKGLVLPAMVDRRLALDLTLFSRGGMLILDKIAGQDYDVLRRRPYIGKVERIAVLLRALVSVAFGRAA